MLVSSRLQFPSLIHEDKERKEIFAGGALGQVKSSLGIISLSIKKGGQGLDFTLATAVFFLFSKHTCSGPLHL